MTSAPFPRPLDRTRLPVSRATLSPALVALQAIGVVAVRHGDGAVLTPEAATGRIRDAIRDSDPEPAATAMHDHALRVGDVALIRDPG